MHLTVTQKLLLGMVVPLAGFLAAMWLTGGGYERAAGLYVELESTRGKLLSALEAGDSMLEMSHTARAHLDRPMPHTGERLEAFAARLDENLTDLGYYAGGTTDEIGGAIIAVQHHAARFQRLQRELVRNRDREQVLIERRHALSKRMFAALDVESRRFAGLPERPRGDVEVLRSEMVMRTSKMLDHLSLFHVAQEVEFLSNAEIATREYGHVHARYVARLEDANLRRLAEDRFRNVKHLAESTREVAAIRTARLRIIRESDNLWNVLHPLIDDVIQSGFLGRYSRLRLEAAAAGARTDYGLLLTVLVVTGLFVGVGFYHSRFIGRPIRHLADTAREILGDRNFARRVPEGGADEIGELARIFNKLTAAIEAEMVSRAHLQAVATAAGEALFVTGSDGQINMVNPAACAMLGYSPSDLVGARFAEFVGGDVSNDVIAPTDERGHWVLSTQMRTREGTRIPVLLSRGELGSRDSEGGAVYVATDITSRVEAERSLGRSRDFLRSLTQHLLAAEVEERERIARDLHDDLGSLLTAIRIHVHALKAERIRDGLQASPVQEEIVRAVDMAQSCITRVVEGLHPQALEHLGLAAAVRNLVADFERIHQIPVLLEIMSESVDVENGTAITAYRLVQEALTNIVKHASARNVRVVLATNGRHLQISVRDDGVGMPARPRRRAGGYGIAGMRERVEGLGGTFEIKNAEPGLVLYATLPLHSTSRRAGA